MRKSCRLPGLLGVLLAHFIHHSLIAANWARTFEWSARNYYSAFRDGAALLYILFSCTSFHFIVVVVVVKQSTLASFYAYARLHWRNFNFLDFWVCEFASSSSSCLVHSLRLWSLLLYVGHQCQCVIYFCCFCHFVFCFYYLPLTASRVGVCASFSSSSSILSPFFTLPHSHSLLHDILSVSCCCTGTSTRNVV